MSTLAINLLLTASSIGLAATASNPVPPPAIHNGRDHHRRRRRRSNRHLRSHSPHSRGHDRHLKQFCGQCIWSGNIICEARAHFLVKNYGDQTLEEARQSISERCSSGDGEPPDDDGSYAIPLEYYCGACPWKNMNFNCDSRVAFMEANYHLSTEKAQKALLEAEQCLDPSYVASNITDTELDNAIDTTNDNEPDDNDNAAIDINNDPREPVSIILFCGQCKWQNSNLSCEDKAKSLSSNNSELTLEEAKIIILSDNCFRDPENTGALSQATDDQQTKAGISIWMLIAIALTIVLILVCIIVAYQRRRKKELAEALRILIMRDEQAVTDARRDLSLVELDSSPHEKKGGDRKSLAVKVTNANDVGGGSKDNPATVSVTDDPIEYEEPVVLYDEADNVKQADDPVMKKPDPPDAADEEEDESNAFDVRVASEEEEIMSMLTWEEGTIITHNNNGNALYEANNENTILKNEYDAYNMEDIAEAENSNTTDADTTADGPSHHSATSSSSSSGTYIEDISTVNTYTNKHPRTEKSGSEESVIFEEVDLFARNLESKGPENANEKGTMDMDESVTNYNQDDTGEISNTSRGGSTLPHAIGDRTERE